MERRRFLRRALAGLGFATIASRALAQDKSPRPEDLADPTIVGRGRERVTLADNDEIAMGVEHRLKCTCPCNLDVFTCRTTDFNCTYSPALHREVLELRKAGKNADQIIQAFVGKYGERILMAPKPAGFNLAGYLVPGLGILGVGGVLAVMLLRRGKNPAATVVGAGSLDGPPVPASADELAALAQALSEVDR